MGEIVNVRCKACKREWQCFTGNGLLHGRRETILAAFLEEDRQQAESLMEAGRIPAYDFQYSLAVCRHCHNVVAVPVLRVADSEETVTGRCPLCRKGTEDLCTEEQSVEEWSEKTACPVCRCRKMETREGGHWD
ncbi:MAG: hypothetical protein K2K90_06690 [Lachnospiraceae bacterium]|nr:hypothetical protein [Lachnospiraceae bacterium]